MRTFLIAWSFLAMFLINTQAAEIAFETLRCDFYSQKPTQRHYDIPTADRDFVYKTAERPIVSLVLHGSYYIDRGHSQNVLDTVVYHSYKKRPALMTRNVTLNAQARGAVQNFAGEVYRNNQKGIYRENGWNKGRRAKLYKNGMTFKATKLTKNTLLNLLPLLGENSGQKFSTSELENFVGSELSLDARITNPTSKYYYSNSDGAYVYEVSQDGGETFMLDFRKGNEACLQFHELFGRTFHLCYSCTPSNESINSYSFLKRVPDFSSPSSRYDMQRIYGLKPVVY